MQKKRHTFSRQERDVTGAHDEGGKRVSFAQGSFAQGHGSQEPRTCAKDWRCCRSVVCKLRMGLPPTDTTRGGGEAGREEGKQVASAAAAANAGYRGERMMGETDIHLRLSRQRGRANPITSLVVER